MSIGQHPILSIETILDKVNSGFFILASDWKIVFLNHAVEVCVDRKREDVLDQYLWDVLPELLPFYDYYHKAMVDKTAVSFDEYYEPTDKWLKVALEPYQNGLVGYVYDYTETKKREMTIQHMAEHDDLTGLPNSRLFEKKMEEILAGSPAFALVYLDIDRFKMINDAFGHDDGDRVIREFSLHLCDHVGEAGFVSRAGSDEFALIFDRPIDAELTIKTIKRLLEAEPYHLCDTEHFLTVSAGISFYPAHGEDSRTLLKKATIALYHAKAQGGNKVQFYDRDVDMDWFKKLTLEKGLQKAIRSDQLMLYYQPRVHATTGEIQSFEALVRWKHPDFGMVMPSDFIPAAEESGLIFSLSYWVKRTALGLLKKWQDGGMPLVPISVNISARCFLADQFFTNVHELLEEFGVEGKWLELEITETSILNNENLVMSRIKELKQLGVKISIDDFGTGYSSLAYLSHYNVDVLKIDRTFISDLTCNQANQIITKAVMQLAHGLGMSVVAEGVETVDQLEFLQDLDCDQIQGYLFSKPVPDTQLNALMKKRFLVPDTR